MVNFSQFITNYFMSISPIYLNYFGYLFVFISAILEAIPFFGILLPGQTIIILSGILAYANLLNLYWLLVFASLGSIIGDLIAFLIGKKYGISFVKKYGKYMLINDSRNKKLKKLIKTNLGKTILVGRFNSISRAFVPFIAGAVDVKFLRFMFYNIISGILWGSTWVLVGYFAGKSFEVVVKYLSYGILIATILSIILWYLFKYLKDKKLIFSKSDTWIIVINTISIFIFSKIIEDFLNNEILINLDKFISLYIVNFYSIFLNNLFLFITSLGAGFYLILITLFITWNLYKSKDYNNIYFFLSSILTSFILVSLIKNLIGRLRPENALINLGSYSLPSGHATITMIISLCIYFIYRNDFKNSRYNFYFILTLISYPLLVGFSRIYLNVHYFSDIIAGFSLGIIIVTSIYLIQKLLLKRNNLKF